VRPALRRIEKMRVHIRGAFVALIAAFCAAACGQWAPPAPTAPSMFQESPASGATIGGVVSNLNTGSPLLAASDSGISVTAVGTNISAAVSVSGKFVLKGVPAGTIFLRFTGPGIDATVLVGAVAERDRLDLTLRVQASSAVIEARVRVSTDNDVEVDGPVSNVSGTCPNLTIKVGEWVLNLDSSSAGSCADVHVGIKIKIKGKKEGSVVIVIKVEVEGHPDHDDDNDDDRDDDDDDD
jgi:hypothetical protein